MAKPSIQFFTDQNVPDSVGKAIVSAGHLVTKLRDCMAINTVDPIIAMACAQGGHVLVSHDNDFKSIAKRLQVTQNVYAQRLHRIDLRCFEPNGARRIAEVMSLIEHEWRLVTKRKTPMVIEIKDTIIRIMR